MEKSSKVIKSFIDFKGKWQKKWAYYCFWLFEYYWAGVMNTRKDIPDIDYNEDIEDKIKEEADNLFRKYAYDAGYKSVLDYAIDLLWDEYGEPIDTDMDPDQFEDSSEFLFLSESLWALSILYENFDTVAERLAKRLNWDLVAMSPDEQLFFRLDTLSGTFLEKMFLMQCFWILNPCAASSILAGGTNDFRHLFSIT